MHLDNTYADPLLAFVRGRLLQGDAISLRSELISKPLEELSESEKQEILDAGLNAELRLYKFKRKIELPRVTRVVGILKGLAPENLLDIGSGRGTFLWPLLDQFSYLPVKAIDMHPQRASDLQAVRMGGLGRLESDLQDVTNLPYESGAFDGTTALEVLEHIPQFASAIQEIVRVSRRFVVVSVPSKEDDNPEHIHLLSEKVLTEAFQQAGASRICFDYVPNHLIALAMLKPSKG